MSSDGVILECLRRRAGDCARGDAAERVVAVGDDDLGQGIGIGQRLQRADGSVGMLCGTGAKGPTPSGTEAVQAGAMRSLSGP